MLTRSLNPPPSPSQTCRSSRSSGTARRSSRLVEAPAPATARLPLPVAPPPGHSPVRSPQPPHSSTAVLPSSRGLVSCSRTSTTSRRTPPTTSASSTRSLPSARCRSGALCSLPSSLAPSRPSASRSASRSVRAAPPCLPARPSVRPSVRPSASDSRAVKAASDARESADGRRVIGEQTAALSSRLLRLDLRLTPPRTTRRVTTPLAMLALARVASTRSVSSTRRRSTRRSSSRRSSTAAWYVSGTPHTAHHTQNTTG